MNNSLQPFLKIVTPKNKRFDNIATNGFLTLDVNGRSFSPQNQEESVYHISQMSKTVVSNYESKKFKIRTTSNSVKATRNIKYFPYQRIKNVEKIIQSQKQKIRNQSVLQKRQTIFDPSQFGASSISLKKVEGLSLNLDSIDSPKRKEINRQNYRLKQIQHIIKNQRLKLKDKSAQNNANIIKFQNRIQNIQTRQIMKSNQKDSLLKQKFFVLEQQKQQFLNLNYYKNNKSNLYSDIVKNRKKLSEKRKYKKKCVDYSLLGRINLLNSFQQNQLILKNSPRLY